MSTDGKPIEIFYADDYETERMLFEIALSEMPVPYHLKTAADGEEAIKFLNDGNGYAPDLIFLDINMPRKNGIECLDEIRKNEKFKHTPVIIFSSSNEERDVKKAYKHDASLYVQKPLSILEQTALLKDILTFDWKDYIPRPSSDKFVFKLKS